MHLADACFQLGWCILIFIQNNLSVSDDKSYPVLSQQCSVGLFQLDSVIGHMESHQWTVPEGTHLHPRTTALPFGMWTLYYWTKSFCQNGHLCFSYQLVFISNMSFCGSEGSLVLELTRAFLRSPRPSSWWWELGDLGSGCGAQCWEQTAWWFLFLLMGACM